MQLVLHPDARRDIIEGADWYDSKTFGLGDAFRMEVDQAFGTITEMPETWSLRRMGEPSLACHNLSTHVYRFVMLPTWGRPAAVRVSFAARSTPLVAVGLTGAGGYDPGQRAFRATRELNYAERSELRRAIQRARFWSTPTRDDSVQVRDGTEWVLEGRLGNSYHVVARSSPRPGPFRELGLMLARFAAITTH